jgi:iron complex outermembrane recepter protein
MFTRSALSSAVALAMALGSQPLLAQDQPAPAASDEVEEIVVSGIKESLTKALEIKKESIQIVDSVVAEDIGKFPDNNLVESLQRVTGVQTTNRGSGEVSGITIRGLPDVETTINGREIFTGIGRTLALQDIPANLLNRVDVFKTRSANQIEGGMAGSIDVRTNRPFDFEGRKIAVSAKGTYQTTSEEYDPNFSALFSDRWDTSIGEMGALLNVSTVKTHYRDQSASVGALFPMFTEDFDNDHKAGTQIPPTYGNDVVWVQGTEGGLPTAAGSTLTMGGKNIDYVLERDAMFLSDFQGTRERPAANLSLQWAPNDSSEYVFETFYTGYRNLSENRLLFTFINGASKFQNSELYPGTNVVHKVYVNNPKGFTSGDGSEGQTDSIMYALGAKWDISEDFKVKADLNHQISNYETRFVANQWNFTRYQAIADYNYHNNNTLMLAFLDNPATAFDESDMTQLGNTTFGNFYDNGDKQHGEGTTLTLDGEYDANWGIITKTRFGLRVDERKANTRHKEQFSSGCSTKGAACDISKFQDVIDISRSGFFDGYGYVPSQWFAAKGSELINNTETYRELFGVSANGGDYVPSAAFDVKELNTALYGEFDFETELGGKKIDGNFGLRAVQIKNTSHFNVNNYTADGVTLVPTTSESTDTRVLPSFGVRYWLEDDLVARFNYGETLRRPGFGDLNPSINLALPNTTSFGTAGSGNPDLGPTESKNYDLGLEWYFAKSSSLYGVLFERDVKGFVWNSNSQISFTNLPDDRYNNVTYIYTRPENSSDGWLKGAEVGLVYFPENLPSVLDGLGGQFSYTLLDSSQTIPVYDKEGNQTGTQDTSLFGVSDSSYSAVLAYEKHGFSARLSYVWREKFLQRHDGTQFASPLQIYSAPEESLDLQLSYNINDNWVVTLDGTNLTNYRFRTYYHSITENNPDYLMNYGTALLSKTVSLGTRFSF